MKYFMALVVGTAATLALGMPAQASPTERVSVTTTSLRQLSDVVVLRGRVAGRWLFVRKVAVKHGRYAVRLRRASTTAKFRVGAVDHYAATVTVAARRRTTTPTPPPTSTDACGTVALKADGSAWSCTFHDEFDGSTLDRTAWVPQTNFAMGTQAAHACYADDPANVGVANGSLNLTVRKVATPVSCSFGGLTGPTSYVSGGVMSYHLFSQQYGRFEARIKNTATTAPGLQESFWLWPDDRVPSNTVWPYAGEIDIAETYSSYPNLAIPFLHYSADAYGNLPGVNTAWNCTAYRGQWNTYALEWTATKLQIFVNGKTCLTNTSGDAAFMKPYIMAFTQGLGAAGNVYDGRAPLPATMNVDYVRVWK